MKKLYENDRLEILSNLEYVSYTILERLYSAFDAIEAEAKIIEKKASQRYSVSFDPDTMDESYGFEEAYHEGIDHYLIHNEMKNEFLNSAATWLFHLFEKDCIKIFGNVDGHVKKKELKKLGIVTSAGSLWSACNKELRLIANVVKHGEGKSAIDLEKIRPELFKKDLFSKRFIAIELTQTYIQLYLSYMKRFWSDFFDKAL